MRGQHLSCLLIMQLFRLPCLHLTCIASDSWFANYINDQELVYMILSSITQIGKLIAAKFP